ncbi:MAG: TetR/AcrR family transcriptional regulator [Myxococcales bacterium]|nr:TetR/AcrR family transcriptional regulator [Myxococcales bacterium]
MPSLDRGQESRSPQVASTPPPSRRRRRTQKERSAETKAQLLDATIECLAELGYTGATSQVIADRAGVSRGAQLHHYGTKMSLVTSALEHLFRQRLEDFRRGYQSLDEEEPPVRGVLRLLRGLVIGPAGYAYLELVMASRTDPDLRRAMRTLSAWMDGQIEALFAEIFEAPLEARPAFDAVCTGLFALLEGLAVERVLREDDPKLDEIFGWLEQALPIILETCRRP